MGRKIGTVSMGVRAPIIKQGDPLADIVTDAIVDLTKEGIAEVIFVIGSSYGLSPMISNRSNFKISLSKMTFLHQFARLILIEQIYRAFKIIKGETYHK